MLAPMGRAKWRLQMEREWKKRGYGVPAPAAVKESVFLRYNIPGSSWVETGTWLGDTTDFLSGFAKHVWSIEPGPELARNAKQRFLDRRNVTIVEGQSEDQLGPILDQIPGDVCLWLDGHFSAGDTFQGPMDTPIEAELRLVQDHLGRLGRVTVLVDDVRCFDPSIPEYSSYPSRSSLVSWADSCKLDWTIEHDIFIARSR